MHSDRKLGTHTPRLSLSPLSCPLNAGLIPQLQDRAFTLTPTSAPRFLSTERVREPYSSLGTHCLLLCSPTS